jgi:hypothetical protein
MMSKVTAPRLPRSAEKTLEGSNWTWRSGSKHWHLILEGRMAAIWPHGQARAGLRHNISVITSIRRVRAGREP